MIAVTTVLRYQPWYCEGTREGRPLRACLILRASFHSIAREAKEIIRLTDWLVLYIAFKLQVCTKIMNTEKLKRMAKLNYDMFWFFLAASYKWSEQSYHTEISIIISYPSAAQVSSCSSNTDQAHNATVSFALKTRKKKIKLWLFIFHYQTT